MNWDHGVLEVVAGASVNLILLPSLDQERTGPTRCLHLLLRALQQLHRALPALLLTLVLAAQPLQLQGALLTGCRVVQVEAVPVGLLGLQRNSVRLEVRRLSVPELLPRILVLGLERVELVPRRTFLVAFGESLREGGLEGDLQFAMKGCIFVLRREGIHLLAVGLRDVLAGVDIGPEVVVLLELAVPQEGLLHLPTHLQPLQEDAGRSLQTAETGLGWLGLTGVRLELEAHLWKVAFIISQHHINFIINFVLRTARQGGLLPRRTVTGSGCWACGNDQQNYIDQFYINLEESGSSQWRS